MHELSIALSIIDLAGERAQQCEASVLAVHVRVGPLSGVVPEALLSAFELAREGTQLANCRLVVEETPVTVYCDVCGAERPAQSLQSLRCGECDAPAEQVLRGTELELTALEIEA